MFSAFTGSRTGRIPKDKFTVREASSEQDRLDRQPVPGAKGVRPTPRPGAGLSPEPRTLRLRRLCLRDPRHRLALRVVTEKAWHSLFALSVPASHPGPAPLFVPEWTILHACDFHADPADGVKAGLPAGRASNRNSWSPAARTMPGEIKKAVFTILNYILPQKGVFPMHCSANLGAGRRYGPLLWALGHGQNHALRRPRATLDRG